MNSKAETGAWRWRVKSNYPVQSGVTPTAGGVVFFGDMGGNFYALDANTGDKLWGEKSLSALQDASAKAADMLKTSCPANEQAITPPARLDAVGKRLEVMLQAVNTVRTALDDFYGKLSDEQKAQFEALGPRRTAASEHQPSAPRTHAAHARHHRIGYAGLIRRLMSMARW